MVGISSMLRGLAVLPFCLSAEMQVPPQANTNPNAKSNPRILILGAGVAGITAARTLYRNGHHNFLVIEARDEIGGRLRSHTFGNGTTIELGANWVQGTQVGDGPSNPIWDLARKHNARTAFNDYSSITTYDGSGLVNYTNVVDDAADNLEKISGLAGYSLVGAKPQSSHDKVAEYFNFDWEYGDTPSATSLAAAGLVRVSQGTFSDEARLSIDQRGFKVIITAEAKEFLRPSQLLLSSTVRTIGYAPSGVRVTLANGTLISGDYVLCTFSLGVLQNDDVRFEPELPDWKMEAIQSVTMTTYTKVFLQFSRKFWFDTEASLPSSPLTWPMGLYADKERGRYPVWQSLDHPKFLNGSGILFVTVTGQYSERIEALPDQQVQSEVMGVLHSMFPKTDIPPPSDFFFPRWHSDPLYRGSYSNWPASFTREHHDNLRASIGCGKRKRLWFAGEATSLRYFGTFSFLMLPVIY
ncbi:hypothetical protein PLEOSDRAFT_1079138 [Pleurotus ostreatus PC15]|uniref:Amine oxidase domain-containing protein n=1 Tax=Pleurotus ostreatus (strain PC15) TaxID=1137138 RepID=A0A067NJV2_PLEO1|nr:hypothetical protein PLEOSDRAFT_1079138 [Pleurotus ostreatus PC15]